MNACEPQIYINPMIKQGAPEAFFAAQKGYSKAGTPANPRTLIHLEYQGIRRRTTFLIHIIIIVSTTAGIHYPMPGEIGTNRMLLSRGRALINGQIERVG